MNKPKVGIVLMNYNLPRETDFVYEKLKRCLTETDYEICVIDNASDKAEPSKYTTIRSVVNTRTMGAILLGAHYFNRKSDVKYVFYMHNDMDFDESKDILKDMIQYMEIHDDVAVVHPSIDPAGAAVPIGDQIVCTDKNNINLYRQVIPNVIGNISMDDTSPILVRKTDWNLVGGQDPRLSRCYGSGKDFYSALSKAGKKIVMYDGISIIHRGQYTYTMNAGDEPYATLDREAYYEMHHVMTEKYGVNWREQF